MIEIRGAAPTDAEAACEVLRRSIIELCRADHNDDPIILGQWLSNKTPENVQEWISNPDNTVLVAVEHGTILAVGCVTNAGRIILNYVSPDARFRGVSQAMMHALEARAKQQGNPSCSLISTKTARRFYHAIGYVETGTSIRPFGTAESYPMSKHLNKNRLRW